MNKFKMENKDRRKEFLEAEETGANYISQDSSHNLIEFDRKEGFYLQKKSKLYKNWTSKGLKQLFSIIALSVKSTLELREFYYTLRTDESLSEPYATVDNIYQAVVSRINEAEIVCDVPREAFTVGNFPKGFLYYQYSKAFGNPEKKIGFTENIARSVLKTSEVKYAQTLIHIEKGAAATRLVSLGFSELTNSIIETTTGNVTRATEILISRLKIEKNVISFCDADSYGMDMHRALQFGSMNRAYLENKNPELEVAGLFPSVAEELNLPNDVEAKLPLNRPAFLKRMEFMKKYNLLDKRDEAVWMRNKTYELESLSPKYVSTKMKDSKTGTYQPVGLAVYLIEFMRLKGIPLKPKPTENDEDLMEEFKSYFNCKLDSKLNKEIDVSVDIDTDSIDEVLYNFVTKVKEVVINRHKNRIDSFLESMTPEKIRRLIKLYYTKHPHNEVYSMDNIVGNYLDVVKVDVHIANILQKIEDEIERTLESIIPKMEDDLERVFEETDQRIESEFNIKEINIPDNIPSQYTIAEKKMGIKQKDAEEVRKALKHRINVKEVK